LAFGRLGGGLCGLGLGRLVGGGLLGGRAVGGRGLLDRSVGGLGLLGARLVARGLVWLFDHQVSISIGFGF
jgi:hypothetical protein